MDMLRDAFSSLDPDTVAGRDGVTWHKYGERREANLEDLYRRIQDGTYRAKPPKLVPVLLPNGEPDNSQPQKRILCVDDQVARLAFLAANEKARRSGEWQVPSRPRTRIPDLRVFAELRRYHGERLCRFRTVFPGKSWKRWFNELETKTKVPLSIELRDNLISACLDLIERKKNKQRNTDLLSGLETARKKESEYKDLIKQFYRPIKRCRKHLRALRMNLETEDLYRIQDSLMRVQRTLFGDVATIPFDTLDLLLAALDRSMREISTTSTGPLPDEALHQFIRCLAEIFRSARKKRPTSNWNDHKGAFTSPFQTFVTEVHNLLPQHAQIGTNGFYSRSALSAQVDRVLSKLRAGEL
jgi:hypothetical protein